MSTSVTSVVELELAELIQCRFSPIISCGIFLLLIIFCVICFFPSENNKNLSFGIQFGSIFPQHKLDSSAFALLFTEISVVWITEISAVWVREHPCIT